MPNSPLLPKQKLFVVEYLKDLNAMQAAIRAGYKPDSAQANAARLMEHEGIKAAIAEKSKKQLEKIEVSGERVIAAIAEIAFGDIRKAFDGTRLKTPDEWDDETAAAIAGMEIVTVNKGEGEIEYVTKIKRTDRLRALDMLARHHALYKDSLEVTVNESLASRLARVKGLVASKKREVSL
jgi:phage terminase small subunit